jgi:hypothetical protein
VFLISKLFPQNFTVFVIFLSSLHTEIAYRGGATRRGAQPVKYVSRFEFLLVKLELISGFFYFLDIFVLNESFGYVFMSSCSRNSNWVYYFASSSFFFFFFFFWVSQICLLLSYLSLGSLFLILMEFGILQLVLIFFLNDILNIILIFLMIFLLEDFNQMR